MAPADEKPTLSGPRQFATIRWSLVLAAGQRSSPQSSAAFSRSLRELLLSLYAFVRRRGHEADEAQDFTQALFAAAFGKERSRRCPSRAWKVSVVPADVAEALPGQRVGPRTGGETGRRPICCQSTLGLPRSGTMQNRATT